MGRRFFPWLVGLFFLALLVHPRELKGGLTEFPLLSCGFLWLPRWWPGSLSVRGTGLFSSFHFDKTMCDKERNYFLKIRHTCIPREYESLNLGVRDMLSACSQFIAIFTMGLNELKYLFSSTNVLFYIFENVHLPTIVHSPNPSENV